MLDTPCRIIRGRVYVPRRGESRATTTARVSRERRY